MSAPDRPIDAPEDDLLGRAPLAKVIYDLIKSTPSTLPVRIGVYGGWGEGKTSLMRLIAELARQDAMPLCWFTAWPARDSKQLWQQFVKDLEATTENRDRAVWLKRKLRWTIDVTRDLADAHAAAKAGHALAQLAGEALSIGPGDAQRVLSRLSAHERIVVMVDDLDRVDPSLLPTLFMGLHDIFESVGRCAFVMGLDPTAVSKGLGGVNSAWGSAPAFLEKIVQYPFWLRDPTREQHREFARKAAEQWNLGALQLPVDDLLDLLPTNPRQLKQFFRSLARLKSVVMRHDPDELNPILLVGVELLRLADPESAERLLSGATFEDQLRALSIYSHRAGGADQARDSLMQAVNNAVPEDHADRPRISSQLVRICATIAERSSFIGDSEVMMHAALEQLPPPMTIKECREIEDRAAGRSDALQEALVGHAARIGIRQQMATEAFVEVALRRRQAMLTDAANAHAEEDRQELVKKAAALTSSLEASVSHLGVFRQGTPERRIALFWSMFRHFARWASFDTIDDDRSLRIRERELLLALAPEMADVAGEAMSRVAPWSRTPELPETQAADKLRLEIVAIFEPLIAAQIVQRFLQPGGIAALRGNPLHLAENWMMFTSSRFYDPENRARLCEIAQSKSRVVADNFYVFLSELTKAWEAGVFERSREDLAPILKDVDLIHPAWVAATFVAPQERRIGSMKELLGRLQKHMPPAVVLKLPEWASEAKSHHGSTSPSSPDPAP